MKVGNAEPATVLCAWLTLAGLAFVICGSLAPFQFEPVPFAAVFDRFTHAFWRNAAITSRSDLAANVLLMMPIAFCAAGMLRRASTAGESIAAVIGVSLAGLLLSLSLEFAQTFLPARVVSVRDVVAETVGSAIGALGWVAFGPALSVRLERWVAQRHPLSRGEQALLAYAGILAVWQLIPLDLSLEPSVLFHKYREGRLVVGLAGPGSSGFAAWATLEAILIYMPLGLAAGLCWRVRGHRRALAVSMAIGLVAVTATELSHLFVESRSVDLQTILSGTAGAWLGAVLVRLMSSRTPVAAVPEAFGPTLICLGWSALIVWSQLYPFNFISDSGEALANVKRLTSPAFLMQGSTALAIAKTFLMTLPIGLCVRRAVGRGTRVGAAVVVAVAMMVAGLWSGVELGMALLPAGSPALSQIPIATFGAATGLWLGGAALRGF